MNEITEEVLLRMTSGCTCHTCGKGIKKTFIWCPSCFAEYIRSLSNIYGHVKVEEIYGHVKVEEIIRDNKKKYEEAK